MSKPSVESQPKPDIPRKVLFDEAMKGNWGKVKLLYNNKKELQGVPITRAKDTLLHVAVSSAAEEIVLQLLDIVKDNKDMAQILNKKNKAGDTPLHLAAANGLDKVCKKIAKWCPDMVTNERNNLQETPLFSAVRHGNKNAFFELELAIHEKKEPKIDEKFLLERDTTHCRGDDGNNILHYAIKVEQFDLAYEIIHLYPTLVNYVNTSGETALHTLANKPSVFKSGARFGLYDTILYHCTITEPLEYDFDNYKKKETTGTKDEQQDNLKEDENKVMPIYKVCIDLYSLMKHSISWIINTNDGWTKIGIYEACCIDVENPSSCSKTGKAPSSDKEAEAQKEPRRLFAKNYERMILFFKMIINKLLLVLGIASSPKTGEAPSSSELEDSSQYPISIQEDPSSSPKRAEASSSENAEAQKELRRMYPKNHDTMILFFKTILNLLLVVLGIGLTRLQTIRKIKQQHRNAKKVMSKLVNHSTLWEYEETSGGQQPEYPTEATYIDSKPRGETPDLEATDQASHDLVAAKKIMNELVNQKILWKYKEDSGGKEPYDDESAAVIISPPRMTPVEDQASHDLVTAKKIMNELVNQKLLWKYKEASGGKELYDDESAAVIISPPRMTPVEDQASPVLVAAQNGITEMVKKILKNYPVAVMDRDKDKKNIILLAVQFRQVHVYKYMLEKFSTQKSVFREVDADVKFSTVESVFRVVDKDENSVLHLAAMLSNSRPWGISGAALKLQWESKWYQYVRSSSIKINEELISRSNNYGKKPEELFIEEHASLVKDGIKWLTNISQSCSVVAGLVATVAFASASTVPGGVNQSGFPLLRTSPVFQLFAISSLVALCFSVTSIVMFLAILTSGYEVSDFDMGLPVKLILGLTSLFMSFASMLVSFSAGNFFDVENELKFALYPIYAVMCFTVTFFAVMYFPLTFFVIKATIKKVPEPADKMHVD